MPTFPPRGLFHVGLLSLTGLSESAPNFFCPTLNSSQTCCKNCLGVSAAAAAAAAAAAIDDPRREERIRRLCAVRRDRRGAAQPGPAAKKPSVFSVQLATALPCCPSMPVQVLGPTATLASLQEKHAWARAARGAGSAGFSNSELGRNLPARCLIADG